MSSVNSQVSRTKEFIIGGRVFCGCIPVRAGTIGLSFLGLVISGLLAVILWFEVATTTHASYYHDVFICAAVLETLLCLASILGFSGAIARKQLFVMIYAYFLYAHLTINVGVALYLLYMIVHASKTDVVKLCKEGIQNEGAQDQCDKLLKVARWVYVAVASAVLLVEMYIAIIATRYMRHMRTQKRNDRAFRMSQASAKRAEHRSEDIALLAYPAELGVAEFNPYSGLQDASNKHASGAEEGYAAGQWSYDDIRAEEKQRTYTSPLTTSLHTSTQQVNQQHPSSPVIIPPTPVLPTDHGSVISSNIRGRPGT